LARRVKKIRNADLAAALRSGLEQGRFEVRDAIHVMRALDGMSQRALAERSSVATKAIKAIESGTGNPYLDTISRVAKASGLRVAFVSERGSVGLMNPQAIDLHEGNWPNLDELSFELRGLV
jgi:DNA-binding phage protein